MLGSGLSKTTFYSDTRRQVMSLRYGLLVSILII